jgi:hypothetical protein
MRHEPPCPIRRHRFGIETRILGLIRFKDRFVFASSHAHLPRALNYTTITSGLHHRQRYAAAPFRQALRKRQCGNKYCQQYGNMAMWR